MKVKTAKIIEVLKDEEFIKTFDAIHSIGYITKHSTSSYDSSIPLIYALYLGPFIDIYGGKWVRDGEHYSILDVLSLYSVKDNPVSFEGSCTDTQYRNLKKNNKNLYLETVEDFDANED